jgi:hypothetical protein
MDLGYDPRLQDREHFRRDRKWVRSCALEEQDPAILSCAHHRCVSDGAGARPSGSRLTSIQSRSASGERRLLRLHSLRLATMSSRSTASIAVPPEDSRSARGLVAPRMLVGKVGARAGCSRMPITHSMYLRARNARTRKSWPRCRTHWRIGSSDSRPSSGMRCPIARPGMDLHPLHAPSLLQGAVLDERLSIHRQRSSVN